MEIQLAQSEKLIKSWNYSEVKDSSGTTKSGLTVTNKRVILHSSSQTKTDIKEIPAKNISGIDSSFQMSKGKKRKIVPGIIMLFFAVVFGIVGWLLISKYLEDDWEIFAIVFTALFVLLFVGLAIGCFMAKGGNVYFSVVIYTTAPLSTVAQISAGINPIFINRNKNQQNQVVLLRVDPQAAQEIVNTIGTVILEAQNS